jgi:peptide/nickel transport system substrate-binding protein
MKKFVFVFGSMLLCTSFMVYAAGGTGDAGAETTMEAGFDYEEAYGTFHWDTPAVFEQATGQSVGAFKEAPMLADMVASGELPAVEDRLPLEPLVLGKKIGNYGGTFYIANPWRAKGYGALPHAVTGYRVPTAAWVNDMYVNTAKGFESQEQGRIWIVDLREGMKWSDGEDYDADDVIFWWEHIYNGMETGPYFWTQAQRNVGTWKDVSKIDDYTLRFEFTVPTNVMWYVWAGLALTWYPEHYFAPLHPSTTANRAELDAMIAEGGFESWKAHFSNKSDDPGNTIPGRPVLLPWTLEKGTPGDIVMTRNPYYWAVDPEGNQLPYMDEVYRYMDFDTEVINLKALAGELDMAVVNNETFRLGKERESQGKIVAVQYKDTAYNAGSVMFNLNHLDPDLRAIFQDKNFRFGVSHAINREQINQLIFFGVSEGWQVAPWEDSPEYHEGFAKAGIEYDIDLANSYMARAGLEKGSDGFYRRPDGEKLEINLLSYSTRSERMADLITDDLRALGIDVNWRFIETAAIRQLQDSSDYDAVLVEYANSGNEGFTWVGAYNSAVLPHHEHNAFWAPLWEQWWASGGKRGEEPIPIVKEALKLWEEGLQMSDQQMLVDQYHKIADIAADNLWAIGTVKWPGYYKVYSSRMDNWPTKPLAFDRGGDSGRPELYFIK